MEKEISETSKIEGINTDATMQRRADIHTRRRGIHIHRQTDRRRLTETERVDIYLYRETDHAATASKDKSLSMEMFRFVKLVIRQ